MTNLTGFPLVFGSCSEYNGTNNTSGFKDSKTAKGFKVAAYTGVMIIAIVGNVFVISAMKKDRRGKLRKFTYLVITSIAVSDLLMAAVSVPERITRVLSEDRWLISGSGGEILCKAVNFVEKVSITVSALHVMALAFRRFLAVFTPQSSHTLKSYRKSVLAIALMWLFAMLYWSPVLYYGGLLTTPDSGLYCKVRYFYPQWRTSYLVFLILLLGILVMVLVFYSAIWFKLSCSKTLRDQPVAMASVVRRKTTTMVAVIVATFYCCFLPYWVGWIMCSYQKVFCSFIFTFISIYLTHASVAVNPFICLIFSRHYREALRELLPFSTRKSGTKTKPAYGKAMARSPLDRYVI
jgi:hypothetical protein